VGVKSQFWDRRATLNLTGFWTEIRDYQANVNNSQLGLLRGYLANADKVRVRGIEADFSVRPSDRLNAYANGAYTDHEYVSFVDAPCPPELSGGGTGTPVSPPGTAGGNSPANCDISGQWLPGISKWAVSWGAEANTPASILGKDGEVYLGYDASYRSKFSSNASRSADLDVNGYSLHNFRLGFRAFDGFNIYAWVRNAFDQDYFEQLAVTPGSTGLVAGQPGDPRTWGGTVKFVF
jgi:iron complex outermembrane receptor protein